MPPEPSGNVAVRRVLGRSDSSLSIEAPRKVRPGAQLTLTSVHNVLQPVVTSGSTQGSAQPVST